MFSLSPGSKPSAGGGGGDWLGLGGGDDTGGLDLNNVPLKTSTPFPSESKESTSTQGNCIFQPFIVSSCSHNTSFPFLFVSATFKCYVVSPNSAPPERQERQASPPRRAGRRRGDGDNDEFLRMLGITPDEPPKPKQVESADDNGK